MYVRLWISLSTRQNIRLSAQKHTYLIGPSIPTNFKVAMSHVEKDDCSDHFTYMVTECLIKEYVVKLFYFTKAFECPVYANTALPPLSSINLIFASIVEE